MVGGRVRPVGPRARGGSGSAGAGFTLIELVVSLLIVALMAAVAAPAFLSERAPPDLDEAEGRIEALFRLARDSAVRSATPVSVVLDSASALVWLDAHTRRADELPPEDGLATGGEPQGSPSVAPDGSIRLRTEGAFGGGSTLGVGLGEPGVTLRTPTNGESLELPASVTLELFEARSRFTFSPNGSVRGDSLVLRAASGETRTITLDPWSGHVRVR
jgi:prepilin-type N-terminal cleavage/methylation domain-containing protein